MKNQQKSQNTTNKTLNPIKMGHSKEPSRAQAIFNHAIS